MNNTTRMLLGRIDVTKVEKHRLYHGEKGVYLDVKLVPLANPKFGQSHMIVQQVTEEEHAQGKYGPILGNAKTLQVDAPIPLASYMGDAKTVG